MVHLDYQLDGRESPWAHTPGMSGMEFLDGLSLNVGGNLA